MSPRNPPPRISIVTPSYNQGQFIEETIRSVLLQGYPNLEYIIIDGGSTDNSVEIIKKYEPWLTYWISEKDRGQAHAINKGWSRATGDIIAWLNSDDTYAPDALKHVAQYWKEKNQPGMIYGDAEIISEMGEVLERKNLDSLSLEFLLSIRHLTQPAVFISKEFQKRLGFLNDELVYALDFEYFLRAFLTDSTQFVYLPSVLAKSREYQETKTNTGGDRMAYERQLVLECLFGSDIGRNVPSHLKQRAYTYVLLKRSRDRKQLGKRGCALLDIVRAYIQDRKSLPLSHALRRSRDIILK